MRSPLLLFCLLLSGFSGLAFELLWVRLLARALGSTTLSFSTVLAVFFGGLALGAYLAGRRVARVARPARAYAFLEFGIAAAALLLYPVLVAFDDLFATIDPGPGAMGAFARFASSVVLLLVPTLLMGATLPMVISATVTRDEDVGRGSALAYGLNTLGAFLGAYFVTFLLLPELGVFRSTLFAAAANVVAGLIALAVDRSPSARHTPLEEPASPPNKPEEEARDSKVRVIATILTMLGGFAAICLQVVWVRMFSIFMEGTIYGTGSVLIAVLLGIAVGSILIVPAVSRSEKPELWFVGLQVTLLVSVALLAKLLPWLSYQLAALTWIRSAGLTPLHGQLALVILAVLVPTSCTGATFPLLVRMVERRATQAGRSLGALYAANTLGSICGSLATGFVLLPSLGSEATTYVGLLLAALTGTIGAFFLASGERSIVLRAVSVAAPVFALTVFPGFDVEALTARSVPQTTYLKARESMRKLQRTIRFFAEGEVATVAATRTSEGNTSLRLSGLPQGGYSSAPPHHILESVLVGLVPVLHGASLERGMIVGLGAGATLDVLHRLGLKEVDVLELEPKVVEAASVVMGDATLLERPGVQIHINDARHHLLRNMKQGGAPYDLITSMPAHPWVAANIFTEEFFRIARENLSERGIFTTWFGLGKMDRETVQSLMRAFTRTFDYYIAYWVPEAGAYYLVGSNSALEFDLERAEKVWRRDFVRLHAALRVDGPLFLPLRTLGSGTPDTPPLPEGPVNTDDHPLVEVLAPRSSTSSPVLRDFFPEAYLQPSVFPRARRADTIDALLEAALGTPEGRLPFRNIKVRLQLVEQTLTAAKDLFEPTRTRYFEARLQLARGKREAARSTLRSLLSDPRVGGRAGRAYALTFADDTPERQDALRSLPPDADVLTSLAYHDFEVAIARVPPDRPEPDSDPEAFLWWAGAYMEPPLSSEDLGTLVDAAGEVYPQTSRIGLAELCIRTMRRLELDTLGEDCERRKRAIHARRAKQLTARARPFGARGDFAGAAELLERAQRLDPNNPDTQRLLLIALVELEDEEELSRLRRQMRMRGLQAAQVEHLLDRARSAKATSRASGDGSPWDEPTSTSTTTPTP